MTEASRSDWVRAKLIAARRDRALGVKAISFGLIGALNTVVDYVAFVSARAALSHAATVIAAFGALADMCRCGSSASVLLVAANVIAWTIGVTSSYVLNSSFTFAAESQRKLRWRAYLTYVVGGLAGLLASTTVLLIAAQVFLLPVWAAKGCAIVASFVVNFGISNFIIFRVRHRVTDELERRP